MADRWIVLLDSAHGRYAYGPTEDEDTARDFAAFLTADVDPAWPVKLRPFDKELTARWKAHEEGGAR